MRASSPVHQGLSAGFVESCGLSAPIGIGMDLDCNAWITQIASRRIAKFSAAGKVLTTVDSAGAIPEDIAVGRRGDVYRLGQTEVIRFAEDKAKPEEKEKDG